MASVFTYDPDPPRVSSPWLIPQDAGGPAEGESRGHSLSQSEQLSEYGFTKLQAEPQEGPTEYKLHLLLRPRRPYKLMTTASHSSRHFQSEATMSKSGTSTPRMFSRQQRLQHLTTQLLWRLQQSSPYHTTSSKELVIPRLPADHVDLDAAAQLQPIVPGLEESRGALYEIGVSDDGTLVGLTKDELTESIGTLRVMAASLGCSVEVNRMIIVGDCEWEEQISSAEQGTRPTVVLKQARLWVAEALVTPQISGSRNGDSQAHAKNGTSGNGVLSKDVAVPSRGSSMTPQLRVTFTGPTTSGKSSLLGTLSTGTLDNGRGKSRLSLLKHRHEMVSGVTSSIAQELIGYKAHTILNFSYANVESWVDIHDRAEGGRLVLVSDSGGHPRYRRTVLRGLMNWAPHWSILCIAADDAEDSVHGDGATSSARDVLGVAAASVDLVKAHLALSLKLDVPMAVVVTKLDLASKAGLQKTMIKVLNAIKEAGRVPKILQPDQKPQTDDIQEIPPEDSAKVEAVVNAINASESTSRVVPIILTSAVRGTGMGLMHALLEQLPLPASPTARDFVGMALNPEQPKCLFHVDDTYNLPASYGNLATRTLGQGQGVIASGYLRFGSLTVGDELVVGPFPSSEDEDTPGSGSDERLSPGSFGLSISHPSSAELARIALKNAVSASVNPGEWHKAQIVSIRNLRLPVRTLEAGQAGSIGIVFDTSTSREGQADANAEMPRIRRGMVLAIPSKHMHDTGLSLQAASGFTATFEDPCIKSLAVGSLVNVYVASVRAAARIMGITIHRRGTGGDDATADADEDIFGLSGDVDGSDGQNAETGGEVTLELLHNREWIELGSRIILLEGGSQDRSGLEGFVGKITEIVD